MEGGLDLEKQTSIPVEAELFFLTSLFIELIDPYHFFDQRHRIASRATSQTLLLRYRRSELCQEIVRGGCCLS